MPGRPVDIEGLKSASVEELRRMAPRAGMPFNLAKLGHPVDRSEWVMTPQTVNAVNLPAMNALNFPAAILQPPLFDPTSDAAQNIIANANHEFPAVESVGKFPELERLGKFKTDPLNVSVYGQNQAQAQAIFDRAGWR